jgi:hypothetical protein
LAKLLAKERGVRNIQDLPPLAQEQIVAWIAHHYDQTGEWPDQESGSVLNAPGETWSAIDRALKKGRRGLPGGSSLFQLIQKY